MKKINKEIRILSLLVALTIIFLFALNIVHAYFTASAKIQGTIKFANLDVYMSVEDGATTKITNQINLTTDTLVSRGLAFNVKREDGTNNINSVKIVNNANSTAAYIRFYIEVYITKTINDNTYYVDNNGNFVDDNGNYVDEFGNIIDVAESDRGVVVDYGQYFALGTLTNGNFTSVESSVNVEKTVKTVDNFGYATYFYKSALTPLATQTAETENLFNAIMMLESAPNEVLGSTMCLYVSFDAVQKDNKAYLSVFNDEKHGYYNWES